MRFNFYPVYSGSSGWEEDKAAAESGGMRPRETKRNGKNIECGGGDGGGVIACEHTILTFAFNRFNVKCAHN